MEPTLLTSADIDICARTVWGEARGEDLQGKQAVAQVMVNRWKSTEGQFRKDDTLATACQRQLQFSVWSLNDPNFEKMHQINITDYVFRQCLRAVLEAVDRPLDQLTFGSCHYHTKAIRPKWSDGHTIVAEFGNHVFYNDIP